jgi:hypothetical protein
MHAITDFNWSACFTLLMIQDAGKDNDATFPACV